MESRKVNGLTMRGDVCATCPSGFLDYKVKESSFTLLAVATKTSRKTRLFTRYAPGSGSAARWIVLRPAGGVRPKTARQRRRRASSASERRPAISASTAAGSIRCCRMATHSADPRCRRTSCRQRSFLSRRFGFECRQILSHGPLLPLLLSPIELVGRLTVIAARVRRTTHSSETLRHRNQAGRWTLTWWRPSCL